MTVHIRRARRISWKEAVDIDRIALSIGNLQTVASDRASYRRQPRESWITIYEGVVDLKLSNNLALLI